MSYHVETDVRFVFKNGQALIPLQGNQIDLMKLDTVDEFRTVLIALAQSALGDLAKTAPPIPAPPSPPAATTQEADLSAQADKIRREFQRVAEETHQKIAQYANTTNANPAQGGPIDAG